jgi:hypothetical protein
MITIQPPLGDKARPPDFRIRSETLPIPRSSELWRNVGIQRCALHRDVIRSKLAHGSDDIRGLQEQLNGLLGLLGQSGWKNNMQEGRNSWVLMINWHR